MWTYWWMPVIDFVRASFVAVHFPLATLSYAVSDFHITSASIHTSLLSSPSLFFANSQLNSTGVHCVHHRTRRYLPHALGPNWTWTCPSPKRAAAAAAAVNKKNLYMNRPQNTPIHAHYWRHRHWCPKQVNSGCALWGAAITNVHESIGSRAGSGVCWNTRAFFSFLICWSDGLNE